MKSMNDPKQKEKLIIDGEDHLEVSEERCKARNQSRTSQSDLKETRHCKSKRRIRKAPERS